MTAIDLIDEHSLYPGGLRDETVILKFPNYTITKLGVVRNIASGKEMAEHYKKSRPRKGAHVRLRRNGTQYSVSVQELLRATYPNNQRD